MKIYLAGSLPKGGEEEKVFKNWRIEYKDILDKFLQADFIFPMTGAVDESDFLLIVGKDSKSIKDSDLVIVNAEERLGAGTSMELVIAKHFKKPVVTVMPKNSYHRRANMTFLGKYFVEDWVHPFVHTFSDFIVENVNEIEKIKDQIFAAQPKDISIIDQAIEYRIKKLPSSEI
jgi:nucleoside 2-deoxyribosyltransferase